MKREFRLKGVCGACGARMEMKGFREQRDVPEVHIARLLEEFVATRRHRGASMRQVEKETGVSNAFISQLETGKVTDMSVSVYTKLHKWITTR